MLPNTFKELEDVIFSDYVPFEVECLAPVEEWEDYPDRGMRLTITGANHHAHGDGVITLHVSYEKYDQYNLAFEKPNYWDENGQPTLTARESGYYKVNDKVYVMESDDPNKYFAQVSDIQSKHVLQYIHNRKDDETYVQFLERRLTEIGG